MEDASFEAGALSTNHLLAGHLNARCHGVLAAISTCWALRSKGGKEEHSALWVGDARALLAHCLPSANRDCGKDG